MAKIMNKNIEGEELEKIQGNIYYSKTEKELYKVDGDKQTPVKDKEGVLTELKEKYKKRKSFFEELFTIFSIKHDDDEEEKQDEEEDFFL